MGIWVFGFWVFGVLGCQIPVEAQDAGQKYRLLWKQEGDLRFFVTDKLQQLYIVDANNEVIKYAADGQEQFRYNNNQLGTLAQIDVTNPFNILLYYPEYMVIQILDRTLSEVATVRLVDLGFPQVDAVGLSGDNRIWVYDLLRFQLVKVSREGERTTQSNDLSLLLGKRLQPVFLIEKEQKAFLNDPQQGILVFDFFGQYLETIPLLGLERFQVLGGQLVYFRDGHLHTLHLESSRKGKLSFPEEWGQIEYAEIRKDRLFVQSGGRVLVYAIQQ